jgi:hypothetical protein
MTSPQAGAPGLPGWSLGRVPGDGRRSFHQPPEASEDKQGKGQDQSMEVVHGLHGLIILGLWGLRGGEIGKDAEQRAPFRL